MSFYYPKTPFSLAGKTLVVPIVSAGNVSQLAVDLLIASFSLKHVGIFNPKDVIPVVAAREDGESGVTTPIELYGQDGVSIVVVQQRSPALKNRKQEFTESLLDFIQTSGIASVLFLSGINSSNRADSQMITPTYHIVPSNSPSIAQTSLSSILNLPIPSYTSPSPQYRLSDQVIRPIESTPIPFIPGGGLTRRILSTISTYPSSWSIPTACLLQFVMEGDNRGDAHLLAAVSAKVLGIDARITEWKQPSSWQVGLFGTGHDQTLYG
ncbi:hypothetical protein GLOTRDRAFT_115124 [Gloeophyllum trabeum ATCC 11539]|uniref:Proteasome assembly chaperone 2 n=1 Tax=Gloeophyllum trabeum (strain ATCC 11539 / FP-39264 / Madison 617) TaxID=670483 RepID=S7RV04_GLOTA|nr:uncharacterized protein GLOTRDRAFT_115124 [Gloeophyllum trabeum ATCC 11539]EPQ57034.1 hypothetical protein GLOTRDRAFT_115124 [Gloeophyllum trabeum ATCC 11539]